MKKINKTIYEERELSTLHDILILLKENKQFEFFRGHSDEEWNLVPKIGRMFGHSEPSDTWERLESFMLEEFKKYAVTYIDKPPQNDIDWLVLSQHYGMPTGLLDWTTNPLKALFFAVCDKVNEKVAHY